MQVNLSSNVSSRKSFGLKVKRSDAVKLASVIGDSPNARGLAAETLRQIRKLGGNAHSLTLSDSHCNQALWVRILNKFNCEVLGWEMPLNRDSLGNIISKVRSSLSSAA